MMETLSNQLKTKLEAITGIQNIYDFAWVDFDGFPAATITPSGFESNYETTTENQRKYIFTVRLFHKVSIIDKPTIKEKIQEGFRIMRTLVDQVVDGFDKDETLDGIVMPTGKTMLNILPVPTTISYFPNPEDQIIVGEVNIEVNISFDTNS